MDITIIIPTKNRFNFLKKIIKYYNDISFKGVLLILDSSTDETYKIQKEFLKNFTNLDIDHYYSEYTPVLAAKEHANRINTSYVTLIGDDDYYIINGIDISISFLNRNHLIDSVRGKSFLIELNINSKNNIKNIYNYDCNEYIERDSLKRVIKFFNHPRAVTANVWRSNVFIKLLNEFISHKDIHLCPDRYFYDELLFTSMLVANSKIKNIPGNLFVMTLNEKRIIDRNKWETLNVNNLVTSIDYTSDVLTKIICNNNYNNEKNKIKKIVHDAINNFIFNKYVPILKKNKNSQFYYKKIIISFLKFIRIYNILKILMYKEKIDSKVKDKIFEQKDFKYIIKNICSY